MLEPTEYRILANLQAALQQITVGGGYHYDVHGTAVKLDPNQDVEALIEPGAPRPFIVIEVLAEDWDYFDKPDGLLLSLPMTIHWVHDTSPDQDVSRMQTYFRGCADVEKAITVDRGRGGLATETLIRKRAFEAAVDGSQVWAMVDITIKLYRTYGQPNGEPS